MKDTLNTTMNSKKKQLAISAAAVSVVGIAFAMFTPSSGILSKFTPDTFITAQNARSNWTGGSENAYRAKLAARFVSQLDSLVLAILGKGANMTDAQFKTYLTNLSLGITRLGSDARYANDREVQDILGFLVTEINSTITTMNTQPQGVNIISQVSSLIDNTGNNTLLASDLKTNTKNYIQANYTDTPVLISSMIIAQVDPMLVATVAQELGYSQITEQLIVNLTNTNISTYLADADGRLAAKRVKPTQAQVDAYKAIYGKGSKVVATMAERQEISITFTDSSLSTAKTTYKVGEKAYLTIVGLDAAEIYGCMAGPNNSTACNTDNGFIKLISPGSIYSTTGETGKVVFRDGVELGGSNFPVGTYTFYAKNGLNGVKSSTSVTVTATATSDIIPNGTTTSVTLPVTFGSDAKNVTLNCTAYSDRLPSGQQAMICRGSIADLLSSTGKSMKNAFGENVRVADSVTVWGKNLKLRDVYFGTENTDQVAYSDANCTTVKDYPMGSGKSFYTSSFVVPTKKGTESSVDQNVNTTTCNYFGNIQGYGQVWYKNKQIGWTSVTVQFDNSQS